MAAVLKEVSPTIVLRAVDRLSTWTEKSRQEAASEKEIKQVFASLASYVKHLTHTKQVQQESVRKAIHTLMILSLDAAHRLEEVLGKGLVTSLPEFKELESLYQHKVFPLFPKKPEDPFSASRFSKGSSKLSAGLHEMKSDRDYELVFLQKEGGISYLHPTIKSHIELLAGLNVLFLEEESFLKKVECAHDRSCHEIARGILQENGGLVDAFYKEALKFKANPFIQIVHKSLMALMLAANARNLQANTLLKPCSSYYLDFHRYLREAFAPSYIQKMNSEGVGAFIHTSWQLAMQLVSSLFLAHDSQKEMTHLLQSIIPQFSSKEGISDSLSIWDRALRAYFEKMPSGPLLLAAKALQEEMVGFDPLLQSAPLRQLFSVNTSTLDISILHLPSPTQQQNLVKASCVNEFLGWIEFMKSQGRHHLLINLQDRASSKEYARAHLLEKSTQEGVLTVISLDRRTLFYEQSGAYQEIEDADAFLSQCKDQILSESTGFYFPEEIDKISYGQFVNKLLSFIHELFFASKKTLSVQERQDFIEILFVLLSWKVGELLQVDTLSFTDKDGVDDAACMNVELFLFLKMMNQESIEDGGALLTMLYGPALATRERLLESNIFARMQGAVAVFERAIKENREEVIQGLQMLYKEIPKAVI